MFFYLLFAHLAADFLLQPSSLIKWKFKSWKGVFVHAAIHFGSYVLIFLPFLFDGKILLILLGIALSHFCVDVWKVKLELRDHRYVRSFVTDQLLHFSFLGVAAWLIGQPLWRLDLSFLQTFYSSKLTWIGLSAVLIASFVAEVFLFQFQKANATFKPNYPALLARGVLVGAVCVGWAVLR